MIRQILTGQKGGDDEVILIADSPEKIAEIAAIIREAGNERSYQGFDLLEVWGRNQGVIRQMRLREKPATKKKAEPKEKSDTESEQPAEENAKKPAKAKKATSKKSS